MPPFEVSVKPGPAHPDPFYREEKNGLWKRFTASATMGMAETLRRQR